MPQRIAALLLVGLAVAGCQTTSAPVPQGPKPIPLTRAPEFDVPMDHQWPAIFNRASCSTFPIMGEGITDRELELFVAAFDEAFFGSGTPFSKVDEDVLSKAAERRLLVGGAPPSAVLTQMANKEGVDFIVHPQLHAFEQEPRSSHGPHIDSELLGNASVELVGSVKKGAKSFRAKLPLNQLTRSGSYNEHRDHLAQEMGRAVARKLLNSLSKLGEIATETVIYMYFKHFDHQEKKELKDLLYEIEGISPSNVQEISADDPRMREGFTLKVSTTMNQSELLDEYRLILDEDDVFSFDTRSMDTADLGSVLMIIKRS